MPDVIIVGGGVISCATAYYLAKAGASVRLLERDELAAEASGAAAGMLAALSDEGGDRGPAFQRLCLESLALFEQLLPELATTGIDVRYRDSGVLHLALDEPQAASLRKRFEAQRPLAPENAWLDDDDLRDEEPEVSSKAVAGMLCPREHYLDPQRLTLALAQAAGAYGCTVETGVSVRGIATAAGRATGVRSSAGARHADHVLLAAGPWTASLAARLGRSVPVRPVRGQMLSLRGPATPLRHVIWGDAAYLVPREDGQTFVGATVEEAGFRRRTTAAGLRGLRRGAVRLAPGLAEAPLLRSWAGLRPASPDGLPIMGLLPGFENLWVSTGHFRNGILLAPRSGELLAASIGAGRPDAQLAPFSPARFAD